MVKRTLLVALSFALLVILAPTLVEADPVISAPFVTVGVGDTFTIPVSITGATDLTSWQFDLAFNPAIVTANSVTEGPFLSSSGTQSTVFVPGFIDNGGGNILGVADLFTDISLPPSGSGVLANIEFLALAPGVLSLTFSNVAVNLFESFEIADGQVTVTGTTAVPEPTTLMLLASGLALFGMRRLARRQRRDEF
jgi:general secretion pathway protein D